MSGLLSTVACVDVGSRSDEVPERPNVLVFVTDDQRAEGTLSVMPNVRRWFVAEGTRYPNAFATTPLCCPSRASIFSGRYAHNHGVKHNYQSHELDQSATMQRYLDDAGYRTAIAGKFLNQWGAEEPPAHFDRFAIFLEGEYYDRQWNIDGEVGRLPDYTNDVVRARSLDFLQDFEDAEDVDPWFLYVGTNAGHAPFTAEPRYAEAPVPPADGAVVDEVDLSDKPVFGEIRGRTRSIRARQLRTLMSADDLVGDVMTWLDDHGELDHTVAIFMSDNGIQWGEHGFTGKRQVYTPSIRVPLFIRRPAGSATEDDRLAANIDIAPTVLDLAGVDEETEFDGSSLVGEYRRDTLLLEHWDDDETQVWDWASLRTLDYQYVEYYRAGRPPLRNYFDLRRDPDQLRNLLADGDGDQGLPLGLLQRRLRGARSCIGASCP